MMNFIEAIKETGLTTVGGAESHWHIIWNIEKRSFCKVYANGEIIKHSLTKKDLERDDWKPIHKKKEIRPENAGELWIYEATHYHTYQKQGSLLNMACWNGNKSANDPQAIHNKNGWTRIYPEVEDPNIEKIEIEGTLKQVPASSITGLVTVVDSDGYYPYNPLSNIKRQDLLNKPMKIVIETTKESI